jgi:hypothetical protein
MTDRQHRCGPAQMTVGTYWAQDDPDYSKLQHQQKFMKVPGKMPMGFPENDHKTWLSGMRSGFGINACNTQQFLSLAMLDRFIFT